MRLVMNRANLVISTWAVKMVEQGISTYDIKGFQSGMRKVEQGISIVDIKQGNEAFFHHVKNTNSLHLCDW